MRFAIEHKRVNQYAKRGSQNLRHGIIRKLSNSNYRTRCGIDLPPDYMADSETPASPLRDGHVFYLPPDSSEEFNWCRRCSRKTLRFRFNANHPEHRRFRERPSQIKSDHTIDALKIVAKFRVTDAYAYSEIQNRKATK